MLGAGICTIAAADALIRIDFRNAVHNRDGIITANLDAFAETKAAGCAHSLVSESKLGGILAAAVTKIPKNDLATSVTAAADECNAALEFGEIMKLINNYLLAALNSAGHTANALGIVNNRMVINDGDGAFRAGSLTLATGNAAIAADLSDKLIVLFGGRARNKVCSISGNHADETLGAYAIFGAIAAAVAFLAVNDDLSIDFFHCTFGAAVDA